jgi:hypothetical protein
MVSSSGSSRGNSRSSSSDGSSSSDVHLNVWAVVAAMSTGSGSSIHSMGLQFAGMLPTVTASHALLQLQADPVCWDAANSNCQSRFTAAAGRVNLLECCQQ